MFAKLWLFTRGLMIGLLLTASNSLAQTFGVEIHNTLTPASESIAGDSDSQPLNLIRAVNSNPALVEPWEASGLNTTGESFSWSRQSSQPVKPVAWPFRQGIGQRLKPGRSGELDVADAGTAGDEIETDRDSFTPSTKTVARGRLIVESSYSFLDNRRVAETHSFPELLLRYGLTRNVELRLGWNYEIGGGNPILTGNTQLHGGGQSAGLEESSRLLYGFKGYLTEQATWRPETSIIVQGSSPTHGASNYTPFSVTPVAGWRLASDWMWDLATRFQTSLQEKDHFNTWSPSTVLKFPLTERAKGHIEYFAVFTAGRESETVQHFVSPGIHYLLHSDLEVGWRLGWGLNDQSPNFFGNLGVGWRY